MEWGWVLGSERHQESVFITRVKTKGTASLWILLSKSDASGPKRDKSVQDREEDSGLSDPAFVV